MEIVRGIDLKLKNEKTPQERILWWVIILAITTLFVLYVLREIGGFFSKMINDTNRATPTSAP